MITLKESKANLLSVMTQKSATIEQYSDIFAARLTLLIMEAGTEKKTPLPKTKMIWQAVVVVSLKK
jgi:hypothetical protein